MSLTIVNHYSFTPGHNLFFAYMWYDPNGCGSNDHFHETGWYTIPAGGSATVWGGKVGFNRNWYYYAESTDGATWAGDIQGWVSNSAFELCHGEQCSPCRTVGFRLLDVGTVDNFTLTLSL